MAEKGPGRGSLFADLAALGRSIGDLMRAVKERGKRKGVGDSSQAEPPAPLALPTPTPHFESAQLLTQQTPGWHRPEPATLAAPSYAPSMTAFGILFIALGAVTKWPLSIIGALIFVLALAKWIGELLHD